MRSVEIRELLHVVTEDAVALQEFKGRVTDVTADSRRVRPGSLFVAIPGVAVDGESFVDEARMRGAVAVVSERAGKSGRDRRVVVADARAALSRLVAAFYDQPSRSLYAVGITGTNGKTTTAYLVHALLGEAGLRPGLISTVEYRVGARRIPAERTTPDAQTLQSFLAQMVEQGCRSVVMEVSSHALAQRRADDVAFDVGVFTNLTQDHLDYHGTMENYFQAKRRLFELVAASPKRGALVANADDPWAERMLAGGAGMGNAWRYGFSSSAEVRAVDVVCTAEGSRFSVVSPWGSAVIESRLRGRFNVSNLLAAFCVGGAMGLAPERLASALSAASGAPGRLEEVPSGRGFRVFVDYAHTEDALRNVLDTLKALKPRRLIAVFGCGGNRDEGKREKMGRVAARAADHTVLTSDNPRREEPMAIVSQIEKGFGDGGSYDIETDRRLAIEKALRMAGAGDIVLIAGKGHERVQEFADRKAPFDDVAVAREVIDEL